MSDGLGGSGLDVDDDDVELADDDDAELAAAGMYRCKCGQVKTIVTDAHREQARALGWKFDPDRCLACESYDAIVAARNEHKMLTTGEFMTLFGRAGRLHGPRLLLDAHLSRVIADETVTACIGDAWSGPEFPEQSLCRADWLDLFTVAGFTIDGKPAERPDEPVELWRGAAHDRRQGMSWTSDRAKAEWFAARWTQVDLDEGGSLYRTVAPPEALLCVNNGRNESEHVINPRGLHIRAESR